MKIVATTLLFLICTFAGAIQADEPHHSAELIFPLEHWHNHGSCIVECPNGDLLVCWFHGSGERKEDEERSAILGTIHWSKGSERERVIVNTTRLPIVPPPRKPGKLPTGSAPSMDEERRLVYVGITRAKSEAILMGSREWQEMEMDTSPFVEELIAAGVL